MHPVAVAGSGLALSGDKAGKRAARVRGRCLSAGCARRGASVRLGRVRSGINVRSYRFVKT
jgi:hypothetical protein